MFKEESKPEDKDDDDTPEPPKNKGKLILGAKCAPADMSYSSDLSLINELRENTEQMIDELWQHSKKQGHKTNYSHKKSEGTLDLSQN